MLSASIWSYGSAPAIGRRKSVIVSLESASASHCFHTAQFNAPLLVPAAPSSPITLHRSAVNHSLPSFPFPKPSSYVFEEMTHPFFTPRW